MRKPRILLSGLGGSLFPYLHYKLETKYDLYYVDSDASLRQLYPELNFFPAPLVTDNSYVEFIKQIIEREAIDLYVPLIDEEIEVAHRIASECPNLNLLSPNLSFCKLALRKDLLMSELARYEISKIDTWTGDDFILQDNKRYFVKPISGRGSRGIRKIDNGKELESYYILEKYKPNQILIQECITGQEYTVGAFINKLNDVIVISTRKIISKKGITIKAVAETNESINEVVVKIAKLLNPKGPINIQLYITDDGEIKIFEINPRFSTTSIMSYEAGIDEIDLWLEYANKKFNGDIKLPKPGLVLHRRWENVFYEG